MSSGKTERLAGEAGVLRAAELLRAGGTVAFPDGDRVWVGGQCA